LELNTENNGDKKNITIKVHDIEYAVYYNTMHYTFHNNFIIMAISNALIRALF